MSTTTFQSDTSDRQSRWQQHASSITAQLRGTLDLFARPYHILRGYRWSDGQADVIAGLTIAVVTIPQAMAYALIAELPPEIGLYSAIVGAVVGALWGSSSHLQTGPTNTTSLLILSVLLTIASPGTPEYVVAAGMMALMVGVFRVVMGLARLGVLVHFVSDSVIVGFTAGAGILILLNQVRHLFRLLIPSQPSLWQTIPSIASHLPEMHLPSTLIGLGTIVLIVILRRVNRKLPGPLLGMVAGAAVVALLRLDSAGVSVVGQLPRGLPPARSLPVLDLDLMQRLLSGSLAVAAIGLVEALSIARSISSQSGQRLDSNQEFIGQGLANIACAFLSGYTSSGSFTRSAVNYEAGARTGMSSVFGSAFVLLAMIVLGPLAAFVPLPALAGVLMLTAYGLVDRKEMARIWQSSRADRLIMIVTLLATLVLPLQYAVLTGILLSLIAYLVRTSMPKVNVVLPDEDFRHLLPRPEKPMCPQLAIMEILGDLYFGATNHVEDHILNHLANHPDQRFLLLRLHSVDHCDISGIHMLESIVRTYREHNGDVYLVRVRASIVDLMRASGFYDQLGADHFLDQDEAIRHLFTRVLDPAVCIYECAVRAFRECQNLPKSDYAVQVHLPSVASAPTAPRVSPSKLWQEQRSQDALQVIDVREPREFARGHIPGALSLPLPRLLSDLDLAPRTGPLVVVCRGGRRSTRAAALLLESGRSDVRVLGGGMIAWEQRGLLQAINWVEGSRERGEGAEW